MAQRIAVFDAHLHVIDPRFPLVADQGRAGTVHRRRLPRGDRGRRRAGGATLAAHEDRLRELPRLSVDHLGLDAGALPVLQRLGCMVKATGFGRVDLDVETTLRALDPSRLMFGTDLPGTRARRPFEPADLELVAAVAPQALADNARAWYRPRA